MLFQPILFLAQLIGKLASNRNHLPGDALLYLNPSLLQNFFNTAQAATVKKGCRSSVFER
jgi:hypothetical protein